MDAATEKRVLSTLYDSLYDIITYEPDGEQRPQFDKERTFLQLARNTALSPADFAGMTSPSNPEGDLGKAESFARMVDPVPAVSADYAATTVSVDKTYGIVVNSANSSAEPDEEASERYQRAYDYLWDTYSIRDYEGNETRAQRPSAIAKNYYDGLQRYADAIVAMRSTYASLNMRDSDDQLRWTAIAPGLQATIDREWDTWRGAGAAQVEQALQVLDTSINSAIRYVLREARREYSQTSLPSLTPGLGNWHYTNAFPSDFYSEDAAGSFSEISLRSGNLNEHVSEAFESFGGGASWGLGLWSVGGGISGSDSRRDYHMDTEDFELRAKIAVVRIVRPWLNGAIFSMGDWNLNPGIGPGGISDGVLTPVNGGEPGPEIMPLVPTAFILARDIEITADWSSEDEQRISSSRSGSLSVGWGPFKASGHWSRSTSEETFHSEFDGGTLKIPGLQVIGWISEILPFSPPE